MRYRNAIIVGAILLGGNMLFYMCRTDPLEDALLEIGRAEATADACQHSGSVARIQELRTLLIQRGIGKQPYTDSERSLIAMRSELVRREREFTFRGYADKKVALNCDSYLSPLEKAYNRL